MSVTGKPSSGEPSTPVVISFLNGEGGQTKRRGSASNRICYSDGGPSSDVTSILTSDFASLFECTVCLDFVLPPILQCSRGHLVCSTCRPKLASCPTCRGSLENNRNLALEKLASTFVFPCKYVSSGCPALLLHFDKVEHEETCECRPYACPCPGASCKWQGRLERVMEHLLCAHESITTLEGEDVVFLATDINVRSNDLPGTVDWVLMQSCFGQNFMLVLEKQEKYEGHQQYFAFVRMIGTRKQCGNFAYRLELNGPKRRLTWESTPKSIHEKISTAISNSDCLILDTNTAQFFVDDNNLEINVTITTNV